MDYKYKTDALNKIERFEEKVNEKVAHVSSKINIEIIVKKPKIYIRQGIINWKLEINEIDLKNEGE